MLREPTTLTAIFPPFHARVKVTNDLIFDFHRQWQQVCPLRVVHVYLTLLGNLAGAF